MHAFVRLVGLVVWNTRAKGKGRVGKPSIEWTSPFVDHGQRSESQALEPRGSFSVQYPLSIMIQWRTSTRVGHFGVTVPY